MKKVIGSGLMFASCAFLAVSAAPDLMRDSAHSGHWQPTREWTAEKAKCTRYSFVVSSCSITALHRASPAQEKRDLSYFTFADWGGQRVEFVSSDKDPSVISLRRATEGLGGRWAFFLVMVAAAMAVGAAAAASLRSRLA